MGDWLRTIFYGKQLVADRQQCRNTDLHLSRAQQHLSHCEKPSGRQSTLKSTRQTSLAEALGSSS